MKNTLKVLGLICLMFVAFSCSKDDDPADNDFFVGTYKGKVSYKDGDSVKSNDDGKVTVVKVASKTKYNFKFSDGIPNLTGVEFEEDGDNSLINIDFEDGIRVITIDESNLYILYTKDDKVWSADATR